MQIRRNTMVEKPSKGFKELGAQSSDKKADPGPEKFRRRLLSEGEVKDAKYNNRFTEKEVHHALSKDIGERGVDFVLKEARLRNMERVVNASIRDSRSITRFTYQGQKYTNPDLQRVQQVHTYYAGQKEQQGWNDGQVWQATRNHLGQNEPEVLQRYDALMAPQETHTPGGRPPETGEGSQNTQSQIERQRDETPHVSRPSRFRQQILESAERIVTGRETRDHRLVSSQKLGAEKTDHSDEFRPEAPSFPDDQRSQTTLPQNIEKIHRLDRITVKTVRDIKSLADRRKMSATSLDPARIEAERVSRVLYDELERRGEDVRGFLHRFGDRSAIPANATDQE